MESKHIYVILAVVILLFAGFLGFRHHARNQDAKKHLADTYNRLTQMAGQSAKAGLPQMGMALKRYYEANRAYPATLDALHPEFIGERSFIDNINWDYKPDTENFYLGKSIERNGEILTAAIDASMRLSTGSGGRVAIAQQKLPATAPRPGDGSANKSIDRKAIMAELKSTEPPPAKADTQKVVVSPRTSPDRIASVETESPTGVASQASGTYLVWKYPDGHVGIGNVQYPHLAQLDIATQTEWYRVTREPVADTPQDPAMVDSPSTKEAEGTLSAPGNVQATSQGYLVWKHPDGHVGIGNVQYPDKDQIVVASKEKWHNLDQPKTAGGASGTSENDGPSNPGAGDILSLSTGDRYLAWKDKNGTVCFGNVQYPESGDITAVFADGKWWPAETEKSL